MGKRKNTDNANSTTMEESSNMLGGKQNTHILIKEFNSDSLTARVYQFQKGDAGILQEELYGKKIHDHAFGVLMNTFLPNDYPQSVKTEYLEYQLWDGLQGLCSYLRSVVTTRSLLIGAGVGEANTVALSAAISWVLKDGFGMIGSLIVAYTFVNSFEVYTKEWRFVADVLNNVGLVLDLASSYMPKWYFVIIVISSISKSCCGLIAGATKSRISSHFAAPGYLADVCAKESTQETAVALIGLLLGSVFAKILGEVEWRIWSFFLGLLVMHMYANYRLIRTLVFEYFNPQRVWLFVRKYIASNNNKNSVVLSPGRISISETLLLPVYLGFQGPILGVSLQDIFSHYSDSPSMSEVIISVFQSFTFIISIHPETGRSYIALHAKATSQEILQAYFCACMLQQQWPQQQARLTANLKAFKKFLEHAILSSSSLVARAESEGWQINDIGAMSVGKWRYTWAESTNDVAKTSS